MRSRSTATHSGKPGVAGSIVVDHKTVRLLDLYELAFAAHPKWFEEEKSGIPKVEEESPYRILLVEDSGFFRKQAKEYLVSEGFEIVEAEDGQYAWETLTTCDDTIDLVITDIEMPRMNGFELTRKIKTEPHFEGMPVIALTSLASDEDSTHRPGSRR